MVILNIPKKKANVNVFQMRINILLIFNNSFLEFLVIMSQVYFICLLKINVKLFSITFTAFLIAYVLTEQNLVCPSQDDIYIKGIVNLIFFQFYISSFAKAFEAVKLMRFTR